MEVRDGYIKTDIGVIPKDWNLITFDKAFYFLTTASYSRAQISVIGDIYYVHYGDIHTKLEHFLDFEKTELPSIKKEQLKNYNLLKEGDLIMADASEDYEGIGKSVEIKNIDNKNAISGLHTFLLRGKEGVFTNGFKGYIYSNKLVKLQFDKLATGLKVYGVSKGNLKTIQIPLPPLPEQKTIAEVLSDTDNLIQALEKRIAKKRLIKQGTMQKLFSPKEDWESVKLSEITTLMTNGFVGTATSHYTDSDDGILYIQGFNVEENSFNFTGIKRVKQDFHKKHLKSKLQEGDLLTIQTGDVGLTTIIPKKLEGSNCHALIITRFKKYKAFPKFFSFYLNSHKGRVRLKEIETGTTMKHINVGDMVHFLVPLPPLPEQKAIAEVLSDMDVEIEALEKKLAKYKQLKQGLIHNLLTGKIRLI